MCQRQNARLRMMRGSSCGATRNLSLNIFCILLFIQLNLVRTISVDSLAAPTGFSISTYSDQVPGARFLAVSKTPRPPITLVYVGTNGTQVHNRRPLNMRSLPQSRHINVFWLVPCLATMTDVSSHHHLVVHCKYSLFVIAACVCFSIVKSQGLDFLSRHL